MAKRHRTQIGNLQSLFLRLEELVLANSGQDEFEEIFKLIIAKLYDEKFNRVSELIVNASPVEQFDAVSTILRKAENRWPGVLEPLPKSNLTPEHLSVCVSELAQHKISSSSLEGFDEFFEFLVSRAAKGNKGQYFTPRHVVEMCVQLVDPGPDDVVCDPACGSGGFLVHTLQHVRRKLNNNEEATRRFAADHLWGFDLDERAIRIARALMMIAGDGATNLFRLNSLITEHSQATLLSNDSSITAEDTMRVKLKGKSPFDIILTNPPFAGEIRESALLDSYELSRGKSRIERDVLFVERCVNLLKPGGRLAIVLPHNKLSSGFFSDLRFWVMKRCELVAVISLGRNVFMPHTQQKTGVVILRRKLKTSDISTNPVFMAVSEKDGKDRRGNHLLREGSSIAAPVWDRLDHDLSEIVRSFRVA